MAMKKRLRNRRTTRQTSEIHPSREPYRSQLIEALRQHKKAGVHEITQGEITAILCRIFDFSGNRVRGAGAVTRHLIRAGIIERLQTFSLSAKNRYRIVLSDEGTDAAPGHARIAEDARMFGKMSTVELAQYVGELERRHAALLKRLADTLPAVRTVELEMRRITDEIQALQKQLEELGKKRAVLVCHPDWPEFDDLDRKLKEVQTALGLF